MTFTEHTAQFAGISSNSGTSKNNRFANPAKSLGISELPRHAAWGAFQAGMRFLQKYSGRSTANSGTIAKSNLQLLHRTLLKDPSYSQTLQKVIEKGASNKFPASHCVFVSQELRADLITIQSGTSIQLNPRQAEISMYLSISGKPLIQSDEQPLRTSKNWWNRSCQTGDTEVLKNGDAVLVSSDWNKDKRIIAEKKGCVLLHIQLSC